jgi:class 3 adenylate cyclase/tetratricopeptide (TPR) repeat protein
MSDAPEPVARMAGAARRRYLTMLFSDLSDSTRIAASVETEYYSELLARLRGVYLEVIPRHGGTIVQIQGDGVLAIFGYPDAREENARQATEAALDLHDLVRTLRIEDSPPDSAGLSLHTGIHSGLVLFEDGDLVRGRFDLHGNATNIASRLSDVAEADEILVSEETLGPESNLFLTSERRSLTLRGNDNPIGVYRILARAPIGSRYEARARRGLVPFVGRHAELGTLERNLRDAIGGQHRYVAIAAPAGLGKTRLAEEFLDRASRLDCQIHRGYCESYLSAEPLQPFLQILRSHCGLNREMSVARAAEALDRALSSIDPGLLRLRTELLRALSLSVPEGGGEARRPAPERTIAALRDLFEALATRKPLVLFIDDWQWADDATRQVLGAIRGLDRRPIFVLIATRGFAAGDAGMSDALILDLVPFNEDEAAATIARLLPATGPFEIEEISRYSGGNPLFIEELCHSAAHESTDHRPRRTYSGVAWLNTLIESRVARLPAVQGELVRTAAVIGNVIPAWLLERMTGYGEQDPLVRGLAEQDFIFPGERAGTLRFKHGIARDVIYEAVGLRERRAMHLRIAELLQQESAPGGQEELYEALAYHYGAGGQAADAARYAELAGDKAMAASALDRAQTQYRAALVALDLLSPSDEIYRRWSQIAQQWSMACIFDPSRDQLDLLRRAVERAETQDDQAAISRAEYWLGYINYGLGESGVAIHHLERALGSAQRVGDERLSAQIRATLGQARAAACDYDKALVLLDEAIASKRQRKQSGHPAVGFAYTLACKAAVLGDRGLFQQAQACFDEALEAVRGVGHEVEGSILCWRSGVSLWQGRWEDARLEATEAQRVAERVKSLYLYAQSLSLGAYANWVLSRAPASLQTIMDATSWLETRDRGLFISLNYGWLAEGMVASERFGEVRRNAARALIRSHKHDRIGEAMACRALARASARGHDRKPVEHYLDRAMAAANARGSPHEIAVTRLCQAEIELARGNRARAVPLLDQAEAAFQSMAMPWHIGEVNRLNQQD